MTDINRATLLGRLGKDPEVRALQNGDKVASFSIATGEKWKDKQTGEQKEATEWHNVVAFGPVVKIIEQYMRKGSRVLVEGQIRTRKWQDKEGNDRWSTEIVLSGYEAKVILLDAPSGGGSKAEAQASAYGATAGALGSPSSKFDDEIPFAPEFR